MPGEQVKFEFQYYRDGQIVTMADGTAAALTTHKVCRTVPVAL